MRKSVTAFIFGLIGGLFCLGWGFFAGIIGDIGSSASSGNDFVVTQILGWLEFIGGIAAIIGASQCFRRARIGGIVLACSTVACGGMNIYAFVNLVGNGMGVGSAILLILLPIIFLIVATVCAFIAKEEADSVPPSPYGTYSTTSTRVPTKTMEEELTELKAMYEKNLMSEADYNQAKQGIINKYTNK